MLWILPEFTVLSRKLQHKKMMALWTLLEQSESHAISPAAKRTLNLSTSPGAVF